MGTFPGMVNATASARDLRLLVPPSVQHLRAVRLVAADTAGRAGFDCEQTDDLRIAVDELCHSVMRGAHGPITLVFDAEDGRVTIEGSAPFRRDPGMPLLDPLADAILRSVSEFFEVVESPPEVRFMLMMERPSRCN
jgi:anti-sigma regulatory factor (Ser/Thr protein kinase)